MAPTQRVWDPVLRVLHWTLVASMTLCWWGLFVIPGGHRPAGYAALAIVGLRVLWGLFSSNR